MALIDKASLLMVPSTYEAGKLYNVLPSGNRAPDSTDQNSGYDQTRADFTFDRGSNAAATRIGSDGLIKKYRENLLTESNNFSDSDWLPTETSATSGQSGYDGTNDAWKFTPSAVSGPHRIIRTVSGAGNSVITLSVYAKADGYNFIRISENAATGDYATFNLTDGSVESNTGISNTATTTSVGGGWYRCSFSVDGGVSTRFDIYVMESASVQQPWSGNGTDGILIQNAQLETGMVATDYLDSGATTAKAGVLIDLPRIDYSSGAGALLLEPQRVNVITQSEYFAAWIQFNTLNTANAITSPEGVQNANKLIAASGVNNNVIYQGLSAGTYTASIFAKKGEFEGLVIATGTTGAFFNLNTNTYRNFYASPPSYKIEDYGNGWYRYSITFTEAGANNLYIGPNDNISNTLGVTGNNSDGIYIFGAQLEAGSYPTSYIPNHGTSSGVTRAADVCTGGGSAESINSTEGVLYAEISALADDFANYKFISLYDGTFDNFCDIYFGDASNRISVRVRSGGGSIINMFFAVSDVKAFHKVAISWKSNEFKFFVNGVSKGLNTSGAVPTGLNTLDFHQPSNGNPFYGNVKQVAVFNEALSNSELATLTTL